MGSFCELVLGMYFSRDTPDEVLACVSALEQPLPGGTSEPAPALPAAVREPSEWWSPDWREAGITDEFEHEPWRHDWAPWLSGSMTVSTAPSGALVWSYLGLWHLSCRCSFKTYADAAFTFLEWLGPFADQPDDRFPELLGYIRDDQEPRPYLIWVDQRRLLMENLNARTSG